jgi:WD40 repeat protein
MLAGPGLQKGTIAVWETATGRIRLTIGGLSGHVDCLAFSPDGRLLVTGLDDATALVWDLSRFRK